MSERYKSDVLLSKRMTGLKYRGFFPYLFQFDSFIIVNISGMQQRQTDFSEDHLQRGWN